MFVNAAEGCSTASKHGGQCGATSTAGDFRGGDLNIFMHTRRPTGRTEQFDRVWMKRKLFTEPRQHRRAWFNPAGAVPCPDGWGV